MIESTNRRKWRNLLIRPSFQLRLALMQIVFVVVMLAVLVIALLTPLYYDLQRLDELWAQYALARLIVLVYERLMLAIVLIIIASIVYHITFSHRLCGPLVNFRHTFERISRGDLTREIFLRRRDFLRDEADQINTMTKALSTRIRKLNENQAELLSLTAKLPEGPTETAIRTVLQKNQMMLDDWTLI